MIREVNAQDTATPNEQEVEKQRVLAALPRVLFVSVNPFSATSNNGKTFASFFREYPKEKLAQLFFHREIPSSDVCDHYYQLTDEDVLAAFPRVKRAQGRPIEVQTPQRDAAFTPAVHNKLKASRWVRLARQVLWRGVDLGRGQASRWISEFDPEVIFFCGGDFASIFPEVRKLARRCGADLVFYITDDYILPVQGTTIGHRVMRWWTRAATMSLVGESSLVLTIGDAMSREYSRTFDIASTPIMNMVKISDPAPATQTDGLELVYAGSFHSNRWRTLAALGSVVAEQSAQGVRATLHLYGPEPESHWLEALLSSGAVEYHGLVDPDALTDVFADASALVHVESDDPESRIATALSISTKIPEYLASGRPVVAVGPRGIASIDYLEANQVALVATPDDTAAMMRAVAALGDAELVQDLVSRGRQLALVRHDEQVVRAELWRNLIGLRVSREGKRS